MPDTGILCTFHKIHNPQCPIFRLGDIFQEAGENFSEVAVQVGGVFAQRLYTCREVEDVKCQMAVSDGRGWHPGSHLFAFGKPYPVPRVSPAFLQELPQS